MEKPKKTDAVEIGMIILIIGVIIAIASQSSMPFILSFLWWGSRFFGAGDNNA